MINKKLFFFLAFFAFTNVLLSQGLQERELTANLVLMKKAQELRDKSLLRSPSITDTLPFPSTGILDDFSYDSPYPDTALWLNNYVYINRGYPYAPPTTGVATFDGLDENGYPYDFAAAPASSGKADTLTSKPIDLSGKTAADSIYFSFYYQQQGRGNAPESADSLVLQFKDMTTGIWEHVWAKKGSALVMTDTSAWKFVILPITNANYLKKGFQFRFSNYATLSGNVDHWNLDYVYLKPNRGIHDTLFEDVSFVYQGPSILKNYTAMPWEQYTAADLETTLNVPFRNNYNAVKNTLYSYKIFDQLGVQVNTTYTSGAINATPFATGGYNLSGVPLNYTPALTDSTYFTVEHTLTNGFDVDPLNNTLTSRTNFYNYYAYDDGTAEAGVGLSVNHSSLALKITTNVPDTLHAIDIYFNPILTNAELYTFNINVWSDAGGSPGSSVYVDSTIYPVYNQSGYNTFMHCYLTSPLPVGVGTYYVGFTQNTDQFLNVGLDRNINTQDKVYYNVGGGWSNSPFVGSLMMHPVFGRTSDFAGITGHAIQREVTVYPNPATDKLYLRSNTSATKMNYAIMDMFGRTILENNSELPEFIDISGLSNGVYFIRFVSENNSSTTKFIVSK